MSTASEARETVLRRIRGALADVPDAELPEDVPVAQEYAREGAAAPGSEEAVALFAERLGEYRAEVRVVDRADAASALSEALASRGATRVVVPAGFPGHWRDGLAGLPVVGDEPTLSVRELDAVDGVVTTAAAAIAETGTLVLDGGPGQGRRALTLLPDLHVCVLRADQVVASVPEGLSRLDPRRPLTFVSGPSATSDIELERVEGVHGPRTLVALVVR